MKSARSRKRAHDARTARILSRRSFARLFARAVARAFDRVIAAAAAAAVASQSLCKCLLCGDTGQIEYLGGEVAPCPRGCAPATSEAEEGQPA